MSTENNDIEITLAMIEDDVEFDQLWEEFIQSMPYFDSTTERAMARIWFNRGVTRGSHWAADQSRQAVSRAIDTILKEHKQ